MTTTEDAAARMLHNLALAEAAQGGGVAGPVPLSTCDAH